MLPLRNHLYTPSSNSSLSVTARDHMLSGPLRSQPMKNGFHMKQDHQFPN